MTTNRRIRVVHVIGRIDVGGIQKAVLALIRELVAAASERVRALYDLRHTAAGYAALISGAREGT